MFMMTAKVSRRRLCAAVVGIAAIIAGLVFVLTRPQAQPTAAEPAPIAAESNEARVRYLEQLGWKVSDKPAEAMQIRIPREGGEVFTRYNELQKSQGFDLSPLAGKNVMRYVYEIENFPDAAQPVRATLLVYKNHLVGGDITDPSPEGKIRGLTP